MDEVWSPGDPHCHSLLSPGFVDGAVSAYNQV